MTYLRVTSYVMYSTPSLILKNLTDLIMYEQNVDGHTALMFAYNGKNQVEVLLDKYSEYMKESNDNSTRIIKEALQTHVEVVQLLIKGGADLTIKDSEGHVAVDFDYKAPVAVADTPAVAALEGSILPDKEL